MKDTIWDNFSMQTLWAKSPIPFFLGDIHGNIIRTNKACHQLFGAKGIAHLERIWGELAGQAQATQEYEHKTIASIQGVGGKTWGEMHVFEIQSQDSQERIFPAILIHQSTVYSFMEHIQGQIQGDVLTGLPNRCLGQDRLQKCLDRLERFQDQGFTLIYLDLDGFKEINDFWGHGMGDEILKAVAQRLKCAVRQSDTVCRWGGDEFVLLLEESYDLHYVQKMAERIIQGFAEPFVVRGVEIQVGASLGVVFVVDAQASSQELLEAADKAMYQAKAEGPNAYHIAKCRQVPNWGQDTIIREIIRAMENEEFFLQFQPILNLQTRQLGGVEAFIRWNHPSRGILYPSEFMPQVEQTCMAAPLGEWIVTRACRTQSQWRKQWEVDEYVGMHINISHSQFMGGAVFERIQGILKDAHIDPSCIYLDCLKSCFLKDKRQAALASDFCHNLGVNLVLDDLKINLFNLNLFFDFPCVPFRLVKVNGNVVDAVMQKNTTIVESLRTFISILSGMGIKMAVKGIETFEQYEAVKKLKCHMGQGFYFAPPLSQGEFEEQWLDGQSSEEDNVLKVRNKTFH